MVEERALEPKASLVSWVELTEVEDAEGDIIEVAIAAAVQEEALVAGTATFKLVRFQSRTMARRSFLVRKTLEIRFTKN